MTYVLVIHKVEDYDKWKKVFDEHGKIRKAKDSKGATIFQDATDPSQLVIISEWDNLEKAKNFAEADDLKTAMQKAGVTSQPIVYYLEELEKAPF
jgi:heme-degrading monooxygenase HmoA